MKSLKQVKAGVPVRIGILGYSDIARRKFIPALAACDNAVLSAIASRNPTEAASLHPGFPARSYEELLASASVELVYLSLPNHLHEEWAIKTLEAGKHLICEKPLALTLASAEKILACATRNNRLIYENQMFLFHPQHAMVRKIITDGRIGRIKGLRSFFGFPFPPAGNFRLDPLRGGGAFHDLVRYPLGIANHLLSRQPRHFCGHTTWQGELNTGVTATAITTDDELFTFSVSFGQQYEAVYEVVGETGRIRLERAYTTPPDLENRIILTTGVTTTELTAPAADHFRLMIESISAMIRSGSDFSFLNRRAAQIATLADCVQQGCKGR